MNKLPIIILSRDRPLQLFDMVKSIEAQSNPDYYRIIICDNASSDPEMKRLWSILGEKHTIIHNESNIGFEGLNPGLAMVDTSYFVLSDPDIIMNPDMPTTWIKDIVNLMQDFPAAKVGLALDTSNIPDTQFGRHIRKLEDTYWDDQIIVPFPAPTYIAPVDTSFAMYRRDTYEFWSDGKLEFNKNKGIAPSGVVSQIAYNTKYLGTVRVGGPYTATHSGWDMSGKYRREFDYYSEHCNHLASTAEWIKKNGI